MESQRTQIFGHSTTFDIVRGRPWPLEPARHRGQRPVHALRFFVGARGRGARYAGHLGGQPPCCTFALHISKGRYGAGRGSTGE